MDETISNIIINISSESKIQDTINILGTEWKRTDYGFLMIFIYPFDKKFDGASIICINKKIKLVNLHFKNSIPFETIKSKINKNFCALYNYYDEETFFNYYCNNKIISFICKKYFVNDYKNAIIERVEINLNNKKK